MFVNNSALPLGLSKNFTYLRLDSVLRFP